MPQPGLISDICSEHGSEPVGNDIELDGPETAVDSSESEEEFDESMHIE